MELNPTPWLKDFDEARQDIMEDAFLLDALSMYVINNGYFMHDEKAEYFPQVLHRLCGYLTQHALDLHNLEKRLEPDLLARSGP